MSKDGPVWGRPCGRPGANLGFIKPFRLGGQTRPTARASRVPAWPTISRSPAPPEKTISGDVERGKQLYAVCSACHGADGSGNESLNAPSICGQHDWYIIRQLENYQEGLRGENPRDQYGAQMAPIVKTLEGRQDYIDIAAYINSL